MASDLPPVPHTAIMLDDNGLPTRVWSDWFNKAFAQIKAIAATIIDENNLAASVAGNGLAGGLGVPLSVNVDATTIEISADTLRVKDGGLSEAKLAASVAGAGLAGGAGSALSVNVDGSTVEINSDTVRVKDAGITLAKLAADAKVGRVVQDVFTQTGAVATGTTLIPFDDTIPQITEGTEFMTASITPQSVTNRLIIEATLFLASGTAARSLIAALFQDSTASALAVTTEYIDTTNAWTTLKLTYEMAAGTTAATTFRIRAGSHSASTVTFNGQAAGRIFGGIVCSTLRVTERTP